VTLLENDIKRRRMKNIIIILSALTLLAIVSGNSSGFRPGGQDKEPVIHRYIVYGKYTFNGDKTI